jgi:hypothetical protein
MLGVVLIPAPGRQQCASQPLVDLSRHDFKLLLSEYLKYLPALTGSARPISCAWCSQAEGPTADVPEP